MTLQRSIPFDELELAGLLNLPDATRYPVVVLLHGFTGWKEEEHIESLAHELCDRGIGAVRFDSPGSGESGGTFANDYRQSNYLRSVERVVQWTKDELPVARLGIWGHSMGGFVGLESAVRLGGFDAVCGSQPSTGKPGFSTEELAGWKATGWKSFSNRRFPNLELPYDFYLDRRGYDVRKTIGALRAPLLTIAGERDTLTPPHVVRQIFDAAPEPKSYVEFPTGHFYKLDPRMLRRVNDVTLDFFIANLRP